MCIVSWRVGHRIGNGSYVMWLALCVYCSIVHTHSPCCGSALVLIFSATLVSPALCNRWISLLHEGWWWPSPRRNASTTAFRRALIKVCWRSMASSFFRPSSFQLYQPISSLASSLQFLTVFTTSNTLSKVRGKTGDKDKNNLMTSTRGCGHRSRLIHALKF